MRPATHDRPQLLKVAEGLYYFESRRVSDFAVSGVYLIVRGDVALIEAGTSIPTPHLLNAIAAQGIDFKKNFGFIWPVPAFPRLNQRYSEGLSLLD